MTNGREGFETMSIMRRGDEDLHYCDQSHRWVAPPHIDQSAWDAGMRAHLAEHRVTMGGPVEVDVLRECRTPRVPRQRQPEESTVLRQVA
jgi:hypothetical protein